MPNAECRIVARLPARSAKEVPVKLSIAACVLACANAASVAVAAAPSSPYLGQESREIKSLSREDVEAYLSGKGMGLAKAAELNGYPGPAHVLELAPQLALTPEQRARTQALFDSMQAKAIALGKALVEEERKLDRLFATKSVVPELLAKALGDIGALQARLRGAHLEAHLAQLQILTPAQTARYAGLRGYGGADAHKGDAGQHKH
jgi:Spy/CpxP family protein refolding chaperone